MARVLCVPQNGISPGESLPVSQYRSLSRPDLSTSTILSPAESQIRLAYLQCSKLEGFVDRRTRPSQSDRKRMTTASLNTTAPGFFSRIHLAYERRNFGNTI